jgi:hypothetical protein
MYKLVLLLSLTFCGSTFGQEGGDSAVYVVPTTTNAELGLYTPPEKFMTTTAFNGYQHLQTQTTVVLTMVDGANYINIKTGMTDAYFADNKLVKMNELPVVTTSGLNGVVYTATFMLNNRQMTRHIVFIGDASKTLWLSTTFPTEFTALIEKELLNSYTTVHF